MLGQNVLWLMHCFCFLTQRGWKAQPSGRLAVSATSARSGICILTSGSTLGTDESNSWVYGSLEAGLAFSNASLGAVHAMAHSLGGWLDLPHGECNAMLLEHVINFNLPESGERYRQIGAVMGLDTLKMSLQESGRAVFNEVRRLREESGILKTLGDHGVRSGDLGDLSVNALKDACMVTNPRKPTQRDIEVVYGEAI